MTAKVWTWAAAASCLLLPISPAYAADQPSSEPAATEAAEPIDPVRLAAAKSAVDHIFPLGTYARIMDKTLDVMTGTILDSVNKMPVKQLAAIGGLNEEDLDQLGEGTLDQVMAIYDPAYRERMEISMRVMMGEMGKMMSRFEPDIREGLSVAYARRFTTDELNELNAFFATPTGGAFAQDSMMLFMDPEIMNRMQAFMPQMMEEMPAIVEKLKLATSDLPPPRGLADLTDEECAKLAELLGIPVEKLKEADTGFEEEIRSDEAEPAA